MTKDRLYTVNKWNRNLFAVGGNKWEGLAQQYWTNNGYNWDAVKKLGLADQYTQDYMNTKGGWFNMTKEANPFSKGNIGTTMTGIGTAAANVLSPLALNGISSGYSTGGVGEGIAGVGGAVGNAIGGPWGAVITLGSSVLGGLTNRAWGLKKNDENINAIEQNTLAARNAGNTLAGVGTNDDLLEAAGQMTTGTGFGTTDLVKGGWFAKNRARRKGQRYLNAEENALAAQTHGLTLGVHGADTALDDEVMGNFAAFGGPIGMAITSPYTGLERPAGALDMLMQDKYIGAIDRRTDALAKKTNTTYADGGLKSAFLDEFGSDPIGAAVRYNQGLERMEAEREAAANAAAQQTAYDDMQRRMMALETRNQGLEAMVNASMTAPVTSFVTPSEAVKSWAAIPGEGDDRSASDTRMASKGSLRDFVKAHEGFRSNAYWLEGEPAPTIGYGFHMVYPGTTRKVKMGDKLTQEEADRYLDVALDSIGDTLSKKVPNWDKMAQHQRDALVDLAYGTGTNGAHFKKNSKLMSALRNEDWEEAEKQLVSRSKSLPKYDEYLLKISKQRQKMFRDGEYNMKAFGGELGTNGTDFTNGMLQIDAGGSHQSNPLGGVPLGVDPEGVPNLVEEGETVFNDYVFSTRMKVPKGLYEELGLGGVSTKSKHTGLSFADASKKLAQESEQRPNDPISLAGLEASMAKLAEVQEAERAKKEMKDTVEGKGFAYGGLRDNVKGLFSGVRNRLGILPELVVTGDDRRVYNGYGLPEAVITGNDNTVYEGLTLPEAVVTSRRRQYNAGELPGYTVYGRRRSAPTTATPAYAGGINYNWNYDQPWWGWWSEDEYNSPTRPPYGDGVSSGIGVTSSASNASSPSSPSSSSVARNPKSSRGISADRADNRIEMEAFEGIPITAPRETLQGKIGDADLNFEGMADRYTGLRDYVAANTPEEYDPYPTWMRYAPVIGAGALTLADLLGITNRPDYTYANKIEAAAERAGTAPNVRYNPIGNYLRYQPMDIWAEQNRLNANSRGTERSILNSGASQGAKMAGLLASGYNDQVASGELYRKGLEYNDARRQAIADFNRRTDMFNAQMGLEAAMANARYTQAARQYGLSGLAQAAAMRDAIDQRVGAARSLNLNNLLTSLGNIGRENFALNQINSDRSRRHGARANGTSYYKGQS